jgi:formamidopyrimidine-DNA glycosylase
MPELPDLAVYRDAIAARVTGEPLTHVRIDNPFVLRTAVPPIADAEGKRVRDVRRMGKRLVLGLEDDLFLVLHLMIAGRLRWFGDGGKPPKRITLARLEFPAGTLAFTEAGTKRRASLHLVRGEPALAALDPRGLEMLTADRTAFAARLTLENHTLKRALTDPSLYSGIGNAYSDEILHRARLSPLALTQKLSEEDVTRLFEAAQTLVYARERLRNESAERFRNVTAFRPKWPCMANMANRVPCAERPCSGSCMPKTNATIAHRCQTGGKLLADRSLRLLKASWPRSIDELG